MEEANLPRALGLARKQGMVKFDIMSTSFFLSRRTFRPSQNQGLPSWQGTDLHRARQVGRQCDRLLPLPIDRVIELGQQIRI
jgi:KUP system potassium uptake protein